MFRIPQNFQEFLHSGSEFFNGTKACMISNKNSNLDLSHEVKRIPQNSCAENQHYCLQGVYCI